MTPKKYKLLKDLIVPNGKGGVTFYKGAGLSQCQENSQYYRWEGSQDIIWHQFVENNPKWFEEVKEPERIKVNIGGLGVYKSDLFSSHKIPLAKVPAITKAIEQVLNGEYDLDKKSSFFTPKSLVEKMYTQSEYDKAIEDAFKAARKKAADPRTDIEKYYDDLSGNGNFDEYEYSNFKDYQATLKK